MCRSRVDVEVSRHGTLELWRCTAGVLPLIGMELRSSGGSMQTLPLCLKRSGAREAGRGPGDVEVWRYGDLELGRLADVEAWRYGGVLVDVQTWRHGGLEVGCRRVDVEV